MQILYCDECNRRMSDNDLDAGKAVRVGDRTLCYQCAPPDIQQRAAEEAQRRKHSTRSLPASPPSPRRSPTRTPAVEPVPRKGSRRMTPVHPDGPPVQPKSGGLPVPGTGKLPAQSVSPRSTGTRASGIRSPTTSGLRRSGMSGIRGSAVRPPAGASGRTAAASRETAWAAILGGAAAVSIVLLFAYGRRGSENPADSRAEKTAAKTKTADGSTPAKTPGKEVAPPKEYKPEPWMSLFVNNGLDGWSGATTDLSYSFRERGEVLLERDGTLYSDRWPSADFELVGEVQVEKGTFLVFFRNSREDAKEMRLQFRNGAVALQLWDFRKKESKDLEVHNCDASKWVKFRLQALGLSLLLELDGVTVAEVAQPETLRGAQSGLAVSGARVSLRKLEIRAFKAQKR